MMMCRVWRKWIHPSNRHVLSHTLDEPQGQGTQALEPAAAPRLSDVVLEGVDELVAQDVIGVPVRTGHRHDDAVLQ